MKRFVIFFLTILTCLFVNASHKHPDNPPQTNEAKGNAYMSFGMYHRALIFYERALSTDEIGKNCTEELRLLNKMVDCNISIGNLEKASQLLNTLMTKARQQRNSQYEAEANFDLGRMLLGGNRSLKKGFAYCEKAVSMMERQQKSLERDNALCNFYNLLSQYYNGFGDYQKALSYSLKAEQLARSKDFAGENADYVIGGSLSNRAYTYQKMGQKERADSTFQEWLKTSYIDHPDQSRQMGLYMLEVGRYQQLIELLNQAEQTLKERGGYFSPTMLMLKFGQTAAYDSLGLPEKALTAYKQGRVISDTLIQRYARADFVELENAFKQQDQTEELNRRKLWVVVLGFIVMLLLMGSAIMLYYQRRLLKQNHHMVKTIHRLSYYHDAAVRMASEDYDDEEAKKKDHKMPGEGDPDFYDFVRLDKMITMRQLYCEADLNRDKLVQLSGIDKNRLAKLVSTYANNNLAGYINSKRMEHAISLMKKHPEYTLMAIAEECGINNASTFIRVFRNTYGMTPKEYRDTKIDCEE